LEVEENRMRGLINSSLSGTEQHHLPDATVFMGFWIFCIRAGPCHFTALATFVSPHCPIAYSVLRTSVHVPFVPVIFRLSHVRQSIGIVELQVLFVDCKYQAFVHLF
jgi:hypothetical protein